DLFVWPRRSVWADVVTALDRTGAGLTRVEAPKCVPRGPGRLCALSPPGPGELTRVLKWQAWRNNKQSGLAPSRLDNSVHCGRWHCERRIRGTIPFAAREDGPADAPPFRELRDGRVDRRCVAGAIAGGDAKRGT